MKLKKFCSMLLGGLMALSIVGCAPKESGQTQEAGVNDAPMHVFYGDDNGEVLTNPGMGFSYTGFPWEFVRTGLPEYFDVASVLIDWATLEPQEGVYDWELLDRTVERLKNDGKSILLRFYLMPDDVWSLKGYPDWAKEKYADDPTWEFKHRYFNNLFGRGPYEFYHPPYMDARWQELMKNFLTAFAEHYPDGTFDLIEHRCFGLYGEWDSGWGNYFCDVYDEEQDWWVAEEGVDYSEEKTEMCHELIDVYADAFSSYERTKIGLNMPSEERATEEERLEYMREVGFDYALEKGFEVRFDAIYVNFPDTFVMQTLLDENFPSIKIYSETANGFGPVDEFDLYMQWELFKLARVNTASFGFYRGSYFLMPKDLTEQALKEIGYRILPVKVAYSSQAQAGGVFEFESEWENHGCGSMPYQFPLAVTLTDASGKVCYEALREDFDLTSLVYGGNPNDKKIYNGTDSYTYNTQFRLPADLAKGEYTLSIGIADPLKNYANAIALPIGEEGNESRTYAVGKIKIV